MSGRHGARPFAVALVVLVVTAVALSALWHVPIAALFPAIPRLGGEP